MSRNKGRNKHPDNDVLVTDESEAIKPQKDMNEWMNLKCTRLREESQYEKVTYIHTV